MDWQQIGLEHSLLPKAAWQMWDRTILVNRLPDPTTRTEEIRWGRNNVLSEVGFPNFAHVTPHSNAEPG